MKVLQRDQCPFSGRLLCQPTVLLTSLHFVLHERSEHERSEQLSMISLCGPFLAAIEWTLVKHFCKLCFTGFMIWESAVMLINVDTVLFLLAVRAPRLFW